MKIEERSAIPTLGSINRVVRKWSVAIMATIGLTGVAAFAAAGARAWGAVIKVERHEREIADIKMNAYFTCLMVESLNKGKAAEIKLQLDIDLACKRPATVVDE